MRSAVNGRTEIAADNCTSYPGHCGERRPSTTSFFPGRQETRFIEVHLARGEPSLLR